MTNNSSIRKSARPEGRPGVDVLLVQLEVYPERVRLGQEADHVLQAPTQPVDAPGHHQVEPPGGGILVQSVQGRALIATLGRRQRAG
jgi:hypothetical protein